MKRNYVYIIYGILALFIAVLPATAAEVAQGKCVTYDKEAKQIIIEEYDLNFDADNPYGKGTGKNIVFDTATAKIGIEPEPGDILRIAYNVSNQKNVAIKVMNVSKQDLRKK